MIKGIFTLLRGGRSNREEGKNITTRGQLCDALRDGNLENVVIELSLTTEGEATSLKTHVKATYKGTFNDRTDYEQTFNEHLYDSFVPPAASESFSEQSKKWIIELYRSQMYTIDLCYEKDRFRKIKYPVTLNGQPVIVEDTNLFYINKVGNNEPIGSLEKEKPQPNFFRKV